MKEFRKQVENFCNKPYAFPLTLLVIFISFFAMSFSGLDKYDSGFVLTSYRYIFSDPACCEYNFLYYFSLIIGGIFHTIYPSGGIFYYKIVLTLFYLMYLSIAWVLLKNYISRFHLIIGMLLASTFRIAYLDFSHNIISVFMVMLSLWAIYAGLKNRKISLLLIGGVLIGINTFTRLPNITMIILSLLILVNAKLNNIPCKIWLRQFVTIIGGFILGALLIAILMMILGHWNIFLNSIGTGFEIADNTASSHNPIILIFNYVNAYLKIVLFFAILIFTWAYFDKILPLIKSKPIKYILGIGYCLLFPVVTIAFLTKIFGLTCAMYYMLTFFASAYFINNKSINPYFKLIILGNVFMLIFLPLGSDGYFILSNDILTAISCPLILYFADYVKNKIFGTAKWKYKISLRGNTLSYIIWGMMLFFSFNNIIYITRYVHGEISWIYERIYKINAPLGKNIYTYKERAERINSAVDALNRQIKPGDYLLVYTEYPIIGYLTESKPYLPCPMPISCYPSVAAFSLKTKETEKRIKEKPVVIIDNFKIYNSEKESFLKNVKNWPAMKEFLVRNKYGIAWENEYYIILLPEHDSPAIFSSADNYPIGID